jgi:hypothetical protein
MQVAAASRIWRAFSPPMGRLSASLMFLNPDGA